MTELEELAVRLARDLARGGRLVLFLDYDGTLAEFASTPAMVEPDRDLVSLLARLARHPEFLRVVVLSGRSLAQVEALLPVPGLLLAGTYGIEFRTSQGETISRLDFAAQRPILDQIKPLWEKLVVGKAGFFLEDKGWSLALHARLASEAEAQVVLAQARQEADGLASQVNLAGQETFHLLGGDRFLEIAPLVADKGQSVALLLDRYHWREWSLVYLGDDDKDEQAFSVVRQRGGVPVLVAAQPRPTQAKYRLADPPAVRAWLDFLAGQIDKIEKIGGNANPPIPGIIE